MSKAKLIIATAILALAPTIMNAQTLNLKKAFSGKTSSTSAVGVGEFESEGVRYKENGTEASVIASKYSGDVYIPKTVKNGSKTLTVTKIADRAFAGCKRLRSVNMSDASVKEIGNAAFSGCIFLSCVSLSNTVTKIGDDAFHMTNLSMIELPSSLRTLGKRAFYFSALRSITLPNGISTIDARAFSGCAELSEITIPASITSIAADAFENSPSLKKINVAAGNRVYKSSTDGKILKK